MQPNRPLPELDAALLDRRLDGRNLEAGSLRELADQEDAVLLVFLRHYG